MGARSRPHLVGKFPLSLDRADHLEMKALELHFLLDQFFPAKLFEIVVAAQGPGHQF